MNQYNFSLTSLYLSVFILYPLQKLQEKYNGSLSAVFPENIQHKMFKDKMWK